jgi:hypothetical protein
MVLPSRVVSSKRQTAKEDTPPQLPFACYLKCSQFMTSAIATRLSPLTKVNTSSTARLVERRQAVDIRFDRQELSQVTQLQQQHQRILAGFEEILARVQADAENALTLIVRCFQRGFRLHDRYRGVRVFAQGREHTAIVIVDHDRSFLRNARHQAPDNVAAAEQECNELLVSRDLFPAQAIEYVLENVGESHDFDDVEQTGAALDGVTSPKDSIERLGAVG